MRKWRGWGSLVGVWEGGGRMSKWVRGGRKGGWGVERALGDGAGNGWGGKGKGGMGCVCVWRGGYFADMLSYWLVQMLGEGQPQTLLSPAVGKSRETKREREREEGEAVMCFNVDILV